MQEFPNIVEDIKKAEKEYKKGNYVTLEEIMAREGFILADKAKKKYVPGRTLI